MPTVSPRQLSGCTASSLRAAASHRHARTAGTSALTRYEWTVLAGIVLCVDGRYIPIALATGVKCTPYIRLSPHGDVLHDSHAEVLTRRAARAWLLERLAAEHRGDFGDLPPVFFPGEPLWRLRDGVSLHWYVSTLPCGNASSHVFRTQEASGASSLRRGRDGINADAMLRTKPGRWDAPPSISMSCSDKMCMWHALGLQGALLSQWLEPVRAASIVISGAEKPALEACEAALAGRLPDAYRYPLTVHASGITFQHSLESVQCKTEADTGVRIGSDEWPSVEPVPCAASVMWRRGKKSENIVGGIRLGAARKVGLLPRSAWSSVCKRAFFEQASTYFNLAATYAAAKRGAHAYQVHKANIRGTETDEEAAARIAHFLAHSHDERCPDGPCAPFGAWLRMPQCMQQFSVSQP